MQDGRSAAKNTPIVKVQIRFPWFGGKRLLLSFPLLLLRLVLHLLRPASVAICCLTPFRLFVLVVCVHAPRYLYSARPPHPAPRWHLGLSSGVFMPSPSPGSSLNKPRNKSLVTLNSVGHMNRLQPRCRLIRQQTQTVFLDGRWHFVSSGNTSVWKT